jgi:hypothetical protein
VPLNRYFLTSTLRKPVPIDHVSPRCGADQKYGGTGSLPPFGEADQLATPLVRPTAAGDLSGVSPESPLSLPWSTSASENHVFWRACARWAGTSVSQFHFLPRPEPRTLSSVAAGGPVTSTWAVGNIVGENWRESLVGLVLRNHRTRCTVPNTASPVLANRGRARLR